MIYPNNNPSELINKITKVFLNSYNRKFDDFLEACLLAIESKEKEYMELVDRIGKDAIREYAHLFGLLLEFFYIEQKYWDVLGECYMRVSGRGGKNSGEAYTPFHICRFMAAISDPKPGEKFMDPCCGSGAFALAVKEHHWLKYKYNNSKNMFGCDIVLTAVRMAKIQDYLTSYNYMGILLLEKAQELRKV